MAKCADAALLAFQEHGDERGRLVAMEGIEDVPFQIKRVFSIYGVDTGGKRGNHANRYSDFVLICIKGSVSVRLKDAKCSLVYVLDSPTKGLYIPHLLWKEMFDFSEDAVLLVLSSEHYNADEYIYNFENLQNTTDD